MVGAFFERISIFVPRDKAGTYQLQTGRTCREVAKLHYDVCKWKATVTTCVVPVGFLLSTSYLFSFLSSPHVNPLSFTPADPGRAFGASDDTWCADAAKIASLSQEDKRGNQEEGKEEEEKNKIRDERPWHLNGRLFFAEKVLSPCRPDIRKFMRNVTAPRERKKCLKKYLKGGKIYGTNNIFTLKSRLFLCKQNDQLLH